MRPAGTEATSILVDHRRAMFADIGGFSARDLRASDGVYRRWLQPRLRSKRAFALVAEVRGTIVGSAVVWLREDQPRPGFPPRRIPYIMSVYVEPGSRGLGVATRLTEALIEWARPLGYPRLLLHASSMGRSVYGRLGFERTWEMRFGGGYQSGPEVTAPARPPPRSDPPRRRRAPRRAR